jgi:drug/metabolite transporter (DMT)-like permease
MINISTYILLSLAAVFWGANFYFGKEVVSFMSPEMANTLRFGIASLILIPMLFLSKGFSWKTFMEKIWVYIILSCIGIYGFNMLFLVGLKYSNSINGALIMGLNPLLTFILSYFFLSVPINIKQLTGIAISFIGVAIVLTEGNFAVLQNMNFSIGDLLLISASFSFALYNLINKKYMSNVSPLHTTAITTMIAAILFLLTSELMGKTINLAKITYSVWGALLFMAIFGSILAYIFWNRGVAKIGAGKASLFTNFIPLSGTLISVSMGHELVSYQILGGVLILIGVTSSMVFKTA